MGNNSRSTRIIDVYCVRVTGKVANTFIDVVRSRTLRIPRRTHIMLLLCPRPRCTCSLYGRLRWVSNVSTSFSKPRRAERHGVRFVSRSLSYYGVRWNGMTFGNVPLSFYGCDPLATGNRTVVRPESKFRSAMETSNLSGHDVGTVLHSFPPLFRR